MLNGKDSDHELGLSERAEEFLDQAVASEDLPLVERGINAVSP